VAPLPLSQGQMELLSSFDKVFPSQLYQKIHAFSPLRHHQDLHRNENRDAAIHFTGV